MNQLEERMAKLELIQKQLAAIEEKKEAPKLDTKADEVMYDTQATYGEEFVPTDLASEILEKVRNEGTIMSKLPASLVMPTAIYEIPIEGGDMTWYSSSEQTDIPATEYTNSKAGTNKITLTAKKLTSMVYASGELEEDSIINIRTYLTDKFSKSYAELLDNLAVNGDTTATATGNVNLDDSTPPAGSYYLAMNGMRKSAIDNAHTINAGALDATDLRNARKELGLKGTNPDKLLWIISTDVYYKILGLTQIETIEKFGVNATIVNGVLKAIDGVEVIVNSGVPNCEADGKVSVTGGNNTLGTAVLCYKEDMISGFKRNLQLFVQYLPEFDLYRFTAHVRFAFTIKETDAVASLINVTIA